MLVFLCLCVLCSIFAWCDDDDDDERCGREWSVCVCVCVCVLCVCGGGRVLLTSLRSSKTAIDRPSSVRVFKVDLNTIKHLTVFSRNRLEL